MKNSLTVICGLPGSGKTTLGRILSRISGLALISSEIIRADLLGRSTHQSVDQDFSTEELEVAYNAMTLLASTLLDQGEGVILEGVFRFEAQRRKVEQLALRHSAEFTGIWVTCEDQEAAQRLQKRQLHGTLSPGGQATRTKVSASFENPSSEYLRLDTTRWVLTPEFLEA